MRILFLEDDVRLGKTLVAQLTENNFEVDWAQDVRMGRAFLTKDSTPSYDICLFDWNLPDGTGLDLFKFLRSLPKSAPVVFLTARIDEETAISALSHGAADFIRKPFSLKELLLRVRKHAGEALVAEEFLRWKDLKLDLKKRRLHWREKDSALSARELQILSLLIKAAGDPVSREQVLAMVDPEGEMSQRTIDSHVSNLRKKIEAISGGSAQIDSVYGMGYALKSQS